MIPYDFMLSAERGPIVDVRPPLQRNEVPAMVASTAVTEGLHVIMCLAFDRRAPVEDIADFKTCLIECPDVLHSMEVTGTFDFMLEAALPDLATYNEKLSTVRPLLAKLVSRYEASFVCRRFIRRDDSDQAIWVGSSDEMRRLLCSKIDKVTAEGDYMRIHSNGTSWLLHSTMEHLLAKLDSGRFVRIHRSTLVRTDFIERLTHQGRIWTIRLYDGSSYRVARSHVADLLDCIRTDSPTPSRRESKAATA